MANKFKFDQVKANLAKTKATIIKKIANESESFFRKGFQQGGFTDASFKAWKPRKSKKSSKPILVKTGRLRGSIRLQINSSVSAKLHTDVPYAEIHNEGGEIQKHAQSRVISFTNVSGRSRFASTRTKKVRKSITHQSRSTFAAHGITMPQRKFMGRSRTLDKRVEKLIQKELKACFKTT